MTLLHEANGAAVHHCAWDALPVEACDTLIVDAPYSARTHKGHDSGAEDANRGADYRQRVAKPSGGTGPRRAIVYSHWTPDDVRAFVESWHPRVNGWMVSITDHTLAPTWADAFEAVGRYAFAPLAYVAPGSRVRLLGDGPSNWTTWIVVARPRSRVFAKWGTLPGAYVLPPGQGGAMPVVGGKPIWLMHRLVEDYSRPGDLCVDPTCGAGTTLVGALRAGRRAIGGDANLDHAKIAADWIRTPWSAAPYSKQIDDPRQQGLGL